MSRKLICPECGDLMELRNSKYGLFYGCVRYPECTGTHGAHNNSGEPLGIPANKETKEWRIRAHAAFDKVWKKYGYTRPESYRLLQTVMGMTAGEAHIGRFDKGQCQRLIRKIEKRRKSLPEIDP